ncbi:aspartate-tRNA ligase [Allomyces macrogynus ATCC 38327]|uniref:Aspartate--tRNA ligase, cytoplasmic n=1 Tax=Allomyces macrogynus (strain ATCC 38327) TaxID=578462 RepID=A0A0L0SZD9_ALLM3|nr:aspartate-tRNA ligase [Allomyces macrogynus ATCC 38327]|eukprot:KNE67770.1 aspartate-tRNA ligase [Allomyces macrogynus ATCC 38327]
MSKPTAAATAARPAPATAPAPAPAAAAVAPAAPAATVEEITQKMKEVASGDGQLSDKQLKKLKKEQEKAARKAEVAARLAAEKAAREAADVDYSTDRYGKLPVNMSQQRTNEKREAIADINAARAGETIKLRARVQTCRLQGNKLCFFQLRQRFDTIQAVLTATKDTVSKHMIKFAGSITTESLVIIEATIAKAPEPVRSCTVQDAELQVHRVYVESAASDRLPFLLEDAARPEADFDLNPAFSRVALDTRLNNRVIDLRTITNQAIFRIQSGICQLFREFLYARGFTEIHTPKMIGAASEGGANVFEVTYFKTKAYLAQSPQFYKQMMIGADFERVFEIGPVFRAENSLTHRHMTEFTGLDLEMSINEHYSEVLDLFDELFVHLFSGIESRFAKELDIINRQYPFEPFQYLKKSLRLTYPEAVALMRGAGHEMADDEDLSTEKERILGKLVKDKYKTDFYMLEKFPLCVRPFYTMPDPHDKMYSNSYDFFMRGEEILSGAQRVHDAAMLEERAREHGVDPATIQPYLDAFKYGVAPHGGGGIGLERVVMLYLNLFNIRRTSLFPRDPKRLEP